MEYKFKPYGVCSYEMIIQVENNIIQNVKFVGGCAGNALGISSLVKGMNINDAINKLKGIPCGRRGTSCPDQLAKALEEIKNKTK